MHVQGVTQGVTKLFLGCNTTDPIPTIGLVIRRIDVYAIVLKLWRVENAAIVRPTLWRTWRGAADFKRFQRIPWRN